MPFPWADWQSWLVTAAALWGAWRIARQFLPRRDKGPACGSCASGAAACAKKPPVEARREASLVVLGDRPS